MIKLYKLLPWCVVSIIPAMSIAGQVAVVNPGSASGVAIVVIPVVTAATTVATPTVTSPTVAAPTVTSPTVAAPTVAAPTATTTTTTTTAPTATVTPVTSTASAETASITSLVSPTQNESNSDAASSAATSVSGYAPQVVASMQNINVSTFTPQQVNTLISSIDALISQPGTPSSVRQSLVSERARLSAIASQ